jgi:tRNA A-37 threonylcarbamoyl transferase component Bud32
VRRVSEHGYRGEVVVGSSIDHYLSGLGDVEALFLDGRASVLKSSRSTRSVVVRVPSSEPSGTAELPTEEVFAKKYLFKNLLHSLKPMFLQHRSRVVWDLSWYLQGHGVSVPEPLGYLVKEAGPFCLAGYIFSEAISDCISLLELAKRSDRSQSRSELRKMMELAADHVAAMHEGGVTHGDLKWSNILFDRSPGRLWLVDLDSAKYHDHGLDPRRVARDLARFVLNALDVGADDVGDCFLDAYALRRNLSRQLLDESMNSILRKLAERHRRRDLARRK